MCCASWKGFKDPPFVKGMMFFHEKEILILMSYSSE